MKISVVIPSFNQAAFLPATLDSVFGQDHPDVETMVFDGGSTDGSVAVLQDYAARHPGQLWWTSGPDGGQADAINRGLARATGDVLCYLNSDDVFRPGALSLVANHFAAHPGNLVLYGRAHHLREDGSTLEDYPTESWNFRRLLTTCFLCQPAVFWRREVTERFGVFDADLHFAMDYEYWLRLGHGGVTFEYLDEAYLAGSRLHGGTKTLSQRVRTHHEILRVVARYADPADPAPVFSWLGHLAHYRAAETAEVNPAEVTGLARRRFVLDFAAHTLLYAEELEIIPDPALLGRLEADLTAVGA